MAERSEENDERDDEEEATPVLAKISQSLSALECLILTGCPVLVGNKWVANKWFLSYEQEFRRPCLLVKKKIK